MSSADDPEFGWARRASQRWADFPVNAVPRPLVLVGPPIVVEGMFVGPPKIKFAIGAVDGDHSVPTDALEILRRPRFTVERPPSGPNVRIRNARSGMCDFATDRGLRRFAAWQFESEDLDGIIWVLDPAIAALVWSPPDSMLRPPRFEGRGRAGRASSTDRVITFEFLGGIPDQVDYPSAEVVETPTSVVVVPTAAEREPFRRQPEAGLVTTRSLAVELQAPLAARVLVDIQGEPVSVTLTV